VIAWLRDQGFEDVYQEVDAGAVADIVAVRGALLVVVELKRALSLDVLLQAEAWRKSAHFAWAAVPRAKSYRHGVFRVAEMLGVGVLEVRPPTRYETEQHVAERIEERAHPAMRRRIDALLRSRLHERQKTAVAGAPTGRGRWTPWRATCERLARAVRAAPGQTLKQLLDGGLKTHYANAASARASIAHWAEAGKIEGVRLERDGGAIRLFPVPSVEEARRGI